MRWVLVFLLLFLSACAVEETPEPVTIDLSETLFSSNSTPDECSQFYTSPPNSDDIPTLLDRFSTQLQCEGNTLTMASSTYSALAGSQVEVLFGIGHEVGLPAVFDISVGCYDADERAYLKSIRFHSFASRSQNGSDVTAIRMILQPEENATKTIYHCTLSTCQVGSESFCSIPKPVDWAEWSGETSIPPFNAYGEYNFDVIVT